MKQHRHYGQYIDNAVSKLKKNQSDYKFLELVWDELDNDYDIHVQVSLKKKKARRK